MAERKKRKTIQDIQPFNGNLQDLIIQAILEKKGEEVRLINLKSLHHVLFDYFIICTGNSKPHVETLTDFIIEKTKKEAGVRPTFVEGIQNNEWVLLDYFNIIVHVFQPETRKFYDIEKLWNDAEILSF
jgi:ribosome-associated protein